MGDERSPTDADRLIGRARDVALGLADTGLTRAEAMLHRVSPAGRARARREREARARARRPVWVAAIGAVMVLASTALMGASPVVLLGLAVLLVAAVVLIAVQVRPAPVTGEILVRRTALPDLTRQAQTWLDRQRDALPAPALPLADALAHRLAELQPQLARLSPEEPAAEAVRKLIATELPGLVDGWRGVPPSLRTRPQADGRTPDAQLVDGLRLIDGEVARMTEQLARGALDEVATQGRYLELKYRG